MMNHSNASIRIIISLLRNFVGTDNCERCSKNFVVSELTCEGQNKSALSRRHGVGSGSPMFWHIWNKGSVKRRRHGGLGKEAAPWRQGICLTTPIKFCRRSVAKLREICASFAIGKFTWGRSTNSILFCITEQNYSRTYKLQIGTRSRVGDFSFKIGIDSVG